MRFVHVVMILVAVPSSAAWGGVPLEGELAFAHPPILQGFVEVSAHRGAILDLVAKIPKHPATTQEAIETPSRDGLRDPIPAMLTWEAARGYRVERERQGAALPGRDVYGGAESRNHSFRYASGELRDLTCHAYCEFAAFSLAAPGNLSVEGTTAGDAMEWNREPRQIWVGEPASGGERFTLARAEGDLFAGSAGQRAPMLRLEDAVGRASGDFGVVLRNVTATLRIGDRDTRLDTRETREVATHGPVSPATLHQPYVVLFLSSGTLFAPGAGIALSAPEMRYRIDGALDAEDASGWIAAGATRIPVEEERFGLRGVFEVTARTESRERLAVEIFSSDRRIAAHLGGDPDEVLIGSRGVVAASAAGFAILGIVLLILLKPAVWISFYSRLGRQKVLDSPRRRDMLGHLARAPGSSVPELARAHDLARVVVRHHMRILEVHGLVRRKTVGKSARFFLAGTPAPDAACSLLLGEGPRPRIAAMLSSGPAGRKELAEEVGISLRLCTYHLGLMVRGGVVEERGPRPVQYALTSVGRDALARRGWHPGNPQAELVLATPAG